MQKSQFHTEWQESNRVLLVRLTGRMTLEQVREWENELEHVSRNISTSQPIKVLIDIIGGEDQHQGDRKLFRSNTKLKKASDPIFQEVEGPEDRSTLAVKIAENLESAPSVIITPKYGQSWRRKQ